MLNFDPLIGFIILGLIFIPLERLLSFQKQKILRKGWKLDIFYYFSGSILSRFSIFLGGSFALVFADHLNNRFHRQIILKQPVYVQFLAAILIAEIGYYFVHRLAHTIPLLWQFHRIHHSVQEMDWLAAVRVHPCEQILTKLCQVMPLYFLGFSDSVLVVFFLFSVGMAFFIHSNLKIKFKGLNYLIATPELHRWHHDLEHNNYNYAAQLPIFDYLFGTFYLPHKEQPQRYGIEPFIAMNYWKQLACPFQSIFQGKP